MGLISEKQGPPVLQRDRWSPWLLKSKGSRKIFVYLIFRPPVFDTTPPGVGDRLKPRFARHGNFTPPRISPSCPQAGVSLYTDGVIAKQLVPLFCGRMGTARHLNWPSFMRKTAQMGFGASSRVALRWLGTSSGNVFQSPDIQFSKNRGCGYRHPRDRENCTRILFSTIKSSPARVVFNRWSSSSCLGDSVLAYG